MRYIQEEICDYKLAHMIMTLRSPTIWPFQTGQGLGTRRASNVNPSTRAGEDWCPSSSRQSRSKMIKALLPSPFCSIQDISGLDDGHPHWGGQSALLILLFQMLILARNTLTHIPRDTQSSGHIKLTTASSFPKNIILLLKYLPCDVLWGWELCLICPVPR